jgi:hypothetical protein
MGHLTRAQLNARRQWRLAFLPPLADLVALSALLFFFPAFVAQFERLSGVNALLLSGAYVLFCTAVYAIQKLEPFPQAEPQRPRPLRPRPLRSRLDSWLSPKLLGALGVLFGLAMMFSFTYQMGYLDALWAFQNRPDPNPLARRPAYNNRHLPRPDGQAAAQGAQVVCLQEFTLSPYFASVIDEANYDWAEPLHGGETDRVLGQLAAEHGLYIVGSIFERGKTAVSGTPPPSTTRRANWPAGRARSTSRRARATTRTITSAAATSFRCMIWRGGKRPFPPATTNGFPNSPAFTP